MNLGFIGCGIISEAHLRGLAELKDAGGPAFAVPAVCDLRHEMAAAFARRVKETLGQEPNVYTDYREMLEKERLEAVSVLVTHDLHHSVAEDCFAAGAHVQMQKPLAISPSFGRKMIEDAKRYGKVLTLSEPSVLGAANVAVSRAVRGGLIGNVYLVLDYAASAVGSGFFAGTPWRHMKGRAGAGWINDHGVHRTHSFLDVVGPVEEVFAYAAIFEKVRSHGGVTIRPTGEDAAVTAFRFANGALGHWMCATAIHGEETWGVRFYGSQGCLVPGKHAALGDGTVVTMAEIVEQYASGVIADPFAHSYLELYEAVKSGKPPISSAESGLEALGIVFAALESATTGEPVRVQDVITGAKHAYEDTVIEEMA
ncbi:Gfo/Idh/MocA family protein [Cohnella candidum]|nr:Gfo/Idh/MocA family oxidoreductase [Cohnella candidum]